MNTQLIESEMLADGWVHTDVKRTKPHKKGKGKKGRTPYGFYQRRPGKKGNT